ncbi:MAG: hypothetical protein M1834_000892 [Cirrosporium novae-zelandiae]|nr:MAG: hypothetical protein M1834_000892 [Cirrosporium novae-zelandiae]
MPPSEDLLRSRTADFCAAFQQGKDSVFILSFFREEDPKITEHGPQWASRFLPFLGQTFSGRRNSSTSSSPTCDDYFDLLGQSLKFYPAADTFPPPEKIVIDTKLGVVSVKAHGKFEAIRTGESWEEEFTYLLSNWDEQGRIGHWEIWADPLSALKAVVGKKFKAMLEE